MILTNCLDKSRLREHLDGSLTASEEAGTIAHLDECESCRQLLETLAEAGEPWLAVARRLESESRVSSPTWPVAVLGLDTRDQPSAQPELGPLLTLLGLSGQVGLLGRLDHYSLLEVIGHGTMGVVFRGFDEKLERTVAVKVLSPVWALRSTARQRFLREARAAAAIRDQHVVAVFAVDECRGVPYLVMEYITGGSLQDWLDREGALPPDEVIRIGREIALGLSAAHELGLIHRDIKPANILLDGMTRRVKITDFGLARTVEDSSLTQDGIVVGTPQFMAPEQARGDSVDHRSDLFSLGVVLYRLGAGRAPFSDDGTLAVLRRVAEDVPTSMREVNSQVPERLDQIVARLLAKEPERRLQTASEVAELLSERLIKPAQFAAETIEFPLANPQSSQAKLLHRRRSLAAAAILLAAASLSLSESSGVTQISATMIRVFTPEGVLSIAVDDPKVRVSIEGEGGIVITGAGPQEVRLRPGSYRINATFDGKTLKDELVTITRGGKRVVAIKREPAERHSASGLVHTLLGHAGYVWSVAFLPDGRRAVSCGADGTVRLWDLQTEKVLHLFQHGAPLSNVALSPDGRFALSAGRNNVIKVWDLEAAIEARPFEGHERPVQNVAISRDGRFVLSGADDNTIRLWDFATRAEKRCLRGHTDFVRTVALVPDGRRGVSGSHDHTVRLWDLETGSELRRYEGNTDTVNCVAVSPDGRRIAAAGADSLIRIWDIASGKLLHSLPEPISVSWVTYSPDGRRLLSGGSNWAVRVWNSTSGQPSQPLEGHRGCVTCVKFSPDGNRALSCSQDGTLRLWQLPL